MRNLLVLGIVLCSVKHLSAEERTQPASREQEIENGTEDNFDSPVIAKRFDPYPYDDGREDMYKRFDPYQKRFDAYEKRFDPYQKRSESIMKRFDPYQKRADPMEKRFDPFEKRFDPYQKRFVDSARRLRVGFNPIDSRAFSVTLG